MNWYYYLIIILNGKRIYCRFDNSTSEEESQFIGQTATRMFTLAGFILGITLLAVIICFLYQKISNSLPIVEKRTLLLLDPHPKRLSRKGPLNSPQYPRAVPDVHCHPTFADPFNLEELVGMYPGQIGLTVRLKLNSLGRFLFQKI